MIKISFGSMLSALLLVCFSAYPCFSEQIVVGQETTSNLLPGMSEFTRSGGTSVGTGNGCPSGEFCTAGTNQQGGTFSTTFDLEDSMTIDDINRGFKLDYSVDVKSHRSNSTLASCTGGVLQRGDCKDIFSVTLSLFSAGNVLEHKFEDQIELDYTGTRNFAFEQSIPENEFTELKGGFDLFGIDAGFPSGFFGPHFANPNLTATFDIVSFIETEVIDILTNTEIITDNPVVSVEVDLAPPPPEPEVEVAEVEIEAEFEQQIEMISSPVEVAPPPVEFAQVDTSEAPVSEQVEAEIEAELQQEIEAPSQEASDPEPETNEQQTEPTEAEPEPEQEPETRQAEQKPKVVAKKAVKEKVAKQIIKRMGSSGRYDSNNQIRTLVVMQVLGDSKSFFKSPVTLQDKPGFFDNARIPDSIITDNNFAKYVLFGGSSAQHNNLVNLQWSK